MNKKKILILVPSKFAAGGIANYYNSLKGKFNLDVEYFERGSKRQPYRDSNFKEIIRAIKDLLLFIIKIMSGKYAIVQTASSLSIIPIFRDAFFIIFAKFLGIKVIVFFRGWHKITEEKIEKKYLKIFKNIYFKADAMIVLATSFKEKLLEWEYPNPIYIETTIVNQHLLDSIDEKFVINKYSQSKKELKILFLASYVGKGKGIYETIDAYIELKNKYQAITLTVAGGIGLDLSEFENVKENVKNKNIEGILFTGYITGENKIRAFKEHDIYIFPSYTEGMPNSLLEALSFGLPAITTPVGGVPDIFESGVNGFIVPVGEHNDIIKFTEILINDVNLRSKIALNNFHLARKLFSPKEIIERTETIFKEILKI